MSHIKYLLFSLITIQSFFAQSQNWQLVWSDEFTTTIGPDWIFETGRGSSGWGNNELQYYRAENATIENGALVITAKEETFGGADYTSARMKTQGVKSWKYGKVESRISIPSFDGSWPAFWMLGESISSVGWPECGEIDIMEHVNKTSDVHGTIHWQDHNNSYANYGTSTSLTASGYHTYTIEWDSLKIEWFIDGVQFHIVNIENGVNGTSEFHKEFFILLNMAVGGNWPGFTVDDDSLPAKMLVDYVRVYQLGNPTGISENKITDVQIFPNPATNTISIRNGNFDKIELLDITGHKVETILGNSKTINISNVPAGVYFIQLYSGNKKTTKKFVKR
tara:strand:- start:312 stop:1319 length:1008 start_codon:yes stop_codon:yes gene_type:complete